jgi:hypothetical protein
MRKGLAVRDDSGGCGGMLAVAVAQGKSQQSPRNSKHRHARCLNDFNMEQNNRSDENENNLFFIFRARCSSLCFRMGVCPVNVAVGDACVVAACTRSRLLACLFVSLCFLSCLFACLFGLPRLVLLLFFRCCQQQHHPHNLVTAHSPV